MATLGLPRFPALKDMFKRRHSGLSDTERARELVRAEYTKSGGATPDLKRVYGSYLDNERKRQAARTKG
jgi:hypothetical protein